MNKKEVTEMAEIRTDVKNIKEENKSQNIVLGRIENKLDHVIECKADKSEVEHIRGKINKITYGAMSGLVFLLITAIGFLLKFTLFKQ